MACAGQGQASHTCSHYDRTRPSFPPVRLATIRREKGVNSTLLELVDDKGSSQYQSSMPTTRWQPRRSMVGNNSPDQDYSTNTLLQLVTMSHRKRDNLMGKDTMFQFESNNKPNIRLHRNVAIRIIPKIHHKFQKFSIGEFTQKECSFGCLAIPVHLWVE